MLLHRQQTFNDQEKKKKHIGTYACTAAELCSGGTAQVGLHQGQPATPQTS